MALRGGGRECMGVELLHEPAPGRSSPGSYDRVLSIGLT